MNTRNTIFLLVIGLLITACGSAPASTPEPTATPVIFFDGYVTIKYIYDDVPEEWLGALPETKEVKVSYNTEDDWSIIRFEMMGYGDVTMFSLEVDPPNDDHETNFGGCEWDYWGSGWDDDSLIYAKYSFDACTSVSPNTEIPTDVTMAYCTQANDGLLCKKQNLTVFVAESYVSFSAEEAFLPQYREWVREVLQFEGGGELPEVLKPNYNYTVSTQ